MSEVQKTAKNAEALPPRPGADFSDDGIEHKSAYDLPLEKLNPINPRLWSCLLYTSPSPRDRG